MQWDGANVVGIEVVDSTQKFKVGGMLCGGGQTCDNDLKAGSYYSKINAPGFDQLIPANVGAAGKMVIKPPAGVISIPWSGANVVGIDLVDSTRKFIVGGLLCGFVRRIRGLVWARVVCQASGR